MPGPIRMRQSCDRCHSQKLWCPKQQGSAGCVRCTKAKASCVFGPIGTSANNASARAATASSPQLSASVSQGLGPPSTISAASSLPWAELAGFSTHVTNGYYVGAAAPTFTRSGPAAPIQDAIDWLAMDAALTNGDPTEDDAAMASSSLGRSQSCTATATVTTTPCVGPDEPPTCGRRLAELQLDIDSIHSSLPHPPPVHMAGDATMAECPADMTPEFNKSFMESIFAAIQRLTNLYPITVKAVVSSQELPPEPCRVPDCIHQRELPTELAGLGEGLQLQEVGLVLASQLMSRHLRLLDVLDRVALYAFSCFRMDKVSSDDLQPKVPLPELKVGSFTPTDHSSQLMLVVLMKDLLSRLHSQLKSFATAVGAKTAESPSFLSSRMLTLQADLLGERHTRSLKFFKSIGSYLINQDLTRR